VEFDDTEAVPHDAAQEFGAVLNCHRQVVIAERLNAERNSMDN
jgi:hypothetical protein